MHIKQSKRGTGQEIWLVARFALKCFGYVLAICLGSCFYAFKYEETNTLEYRIIHKSDGKVPIYTTPPSQGSCLVIRRQIYGVRRRKKEVSRYVQKFL
jgi:hypothetical protein